MRKESPSEQLIDSLVSDLAVVPNRSRMLPPLLIWAGIFATLVAGSIVASSLLRPEYGLAYLLLSPSFLLALLPAVPAGIWAIALSLPGRRTRPWQILTVAFFVLWGLYLVYDVAQLPHAAEDVLHWQRQMCILDILLIGTMPFVFLGVMVRNRFVMNREASAIALFLSSSLAASACAGILCKDHGSLHVFQEHYLPVTALLVILLIVQRGSRRSR